MVYHCPGPGGTPVFTPGVLRCRYVADSGDYSVVDMIPRSKLWGSMCSFCSDVKQAPVYHKRDRTPCLGRAAPASRVGIVQPDPNRIVVNTHPSFIPSIIIYPCHPPPSHSGPTNEQKMEERIKEGPRSLPLYMCCKRLSLQILQNVVARQQPHGQAPQVLAHAMTLGCTRSQRRSQLQRSPCNLRVRMMGLGAKATNRKIAMKVTTLLILRRASRTATVTRMEPFMTRTVQSRLVSSPSRGYQTSPLFFWWSRRGGSTGGNQRPQTHSSGHIAPPGQTRVMDKRSSRKSNHRGAQRT